MKGRQCLCYFYLLQGELLKFDKFFKNNPTEIIKKSDIKLNKNDDKNKNVYGHVVLLTSIEENCIKILNSYGEDWGDKGYFRLENEEVLRGLKEQLVEIYWEKSDLTKEEINIYNNNYF